MSQTSRGCRGSKSGPGCLITVGAVTAAVALFAGSTCWNRFGVVSARRVQLGSVDGRSERTEQGEAFS
jgi:hypothetical protein